MDNIGEGTPKPRDAKTVEAILHAMGVDNYDPRVVTQLLELLYRYVSSALSDSRLYAEHAEKPAIELDDVKLAIRSHCNFSFTQPPPREVTMQIAAERNTIPLPPVDLRAGVSLPVKEYQLTAPNYTVKVEPSTNSKPFTQSPKRRRTNLSPRQTKGMASPGGRITKTDGKGLKIKSPGRAKPTQAGTPSASGTPASVPPSTNSNVGGVTVTPPAPEKMSVDSPAKSKTTGLGSSKPAAVRQNSTSAVVGNALKGGDTTAMASAQGRNQGQQQNGTDAVQVVDVDKSSIS